MSSTAQGVYQLSLISRDLCTGCGTMFSVVDCDTLNEKHFPINQAFFAFVSLLILPIYFKSIQRHVVLLSWLILTLFIIAAYIYGRYKMEGSVVIFIVFFFVSILEFERYKMLSFLLSKEALSYEKNKLFLMSEKSKIIERKLHLALVHQILPPKVAEQIIAGKSVVPEKFEEVTIFFSDVVGFTNICAQVEPDKVVRMLNDLYTVMDYCTSLFPLYKVETIGDAYMLVGGLPTKDPDHASHIANFALLVQRAVQAVKSPADGSPLQIRIGMHSGSVMAGVVGNLMPRYCLFGDTVNTASRMESNGLPNRIHCSSDTYQLLLKTGMFDMVLRGEIEIKGKGLMRTYWLERAKDENDKANAIAIERMEGMVAELLESGKGHEDEKEDYEEYEEYEEGEETADLEKEAGEHDHPIFQVTQGSQDEEAGRGGENRLSMRSISSHNNSKDGNGNGNPVSTPSTGTANGTGGDQAQARSSSPPRRRTSTRLKSSSSASTTNASTSSPGNLSNASPSKSRPLVRFSQGDKVINSSGAKILIVEDVETQRKMLKKRLQMADSSWDVAFAVSGEDALQKLRAAKLHFDVVFVDENLSTNDGLYGHELVQVMRNSFGMKQTVIIACTEDKQRAQEALMEAGVDYVLSKPPPPAAELKAKIDLLLGARLRAASNAPIGSANEGHHLDSSDHVNEF
eukprot:scaffold1623_cov165-Ochromonas_danica.AAC.17